MRVNTAFKRLLDLRGVTVCDVDFRPDRVVVTVWLRRRHLTCPECGFTTRARYDTRPVASSWRHLDLGAWRLEVRAELRRIDCPVNGARTEGVPFARAGSRFTRDFEDLVGWLATTMPDHAWVGRLFAAVGMRYCLPDREKVRACLNDLMSEATRCSRTLRGCWE